ncbi:MAG TPA: hypothetical protein VEH06_01155 [Candidatus Bathyarchaeia archaeon]|nr:hypothetical protein [Candidatus Bathyarchaeia archaeon]
MIERKGYLDNLYHAKERAGRVAGGGFLLLVIERSKHTLTNLALISIMSVLE